MNNPTDTNQASELFELCKEAYEKTGWETGELLSHRGLVRVPLYASDYLLEKLPNVQNSNDISYFLQVEKQSSDLYIAGYIDMDGIGLPECVRSADTPLKALLKLTIVLSEAGELDNE